MAEPILPPNMAAFLQDALSPQRQRQLSLSAALRSGELAPGAAGNGESVMGPLPPPMPPTLTGVENEAEQQLRHHSNYQPRDTGRFVAGKPAFPKLTPEGPPRLNEEPGPPPTPAQNMALEMTGLPSAMRGAQSLASARDSGDPMEAVRGLGQVAAAGPGRGGLAGFLMSEAAAQTPDPRQKRIKEIDDAIRARERVIQSYANKQFPTKQGRTDATKIEQDAIGRLSGERTTLQDQINSEMQAERDRQLAADRGAERAKMPFQKRYPGALEGGVGAMATIGGAVPFLATRGRVRHQVNQVQDLDNQIMAAVQRANNTAMSPKNRTQAANEARALQAQRDQLGQEGGHGVLGHLGAGAGAGVLTELPMAAALTHDYLAGRADPSRELYNKTLESVNIFDHPGEVVGRYAIPFGLGAAAGGAGHYLGSQGGNLPAGHSGQVSTLKQQYRAPRKR